mgnify:FL=1|jgi:hypothetical protein|tara:strand:+ start:5927 stop:6154 length:228 start_codon:yes stop_codon:yes gene_type:complete
MSQKEANLISFKVLLTRENKIVTELSMLPENEVDNVFSICEKEIIKNIIRNAKTKLDPLHKFLEREVNALVTNEV